MPKLLFSHCAEKGIEGPRLVVQLGGSHQSQIGQIDKVSKTKRNLHLFLDLQLAFPQTM